MAKLVTLDNLEVFLAKIREEIEVVVASAIEAVNIPTDSYIKSIAEAVIAENLAKDSEVEDLMTVSFNFTINGSTYTAKEGMTWYEWVNSEYNTKNFSCTQTSGISPIDSGNTVKTSDGVTVKGSDEIVPNMAYTYDTSNSGDPL